MKRLMALLLCVVMCIGLVACGPANVEQTTTPTTQDSATQGITEAPTISEPEELAVDHFKGTKLTIATGRRASEMGFDHADKEIVKLATEATGIEIEWIVLEDNISERLATMLMSDNQPDIYLGFGSTNENLFLTNAELFYDLSEEGLLETYAPNIVRDYDAYPVLWSASIMADGSIRGLVTNAIQSGVPQGGLSCFHVINQEWLDKAGLPVPTTADELYTALKYFKEHDMDGDGDPNNEIPMTFCSGYSQGEVMMLAAPFGIAGNYTWQAHDHYKNIKDGKAVSTVDTEGYRAFLEFFHKLYSEGLLDTEGFSQTKEQYNAKRNAGNCGVFLVNDTYMDQGYTPFLYQGTEGITPMITGLPTRFTGQRSNFAISAESENVEAALWWWNWMSKDAETKNIACGGSDWFYEDENGKFWENPEYQANGGILTSEGFGNFGPVLLPGEKALKQEDQWTENYKIRMEFLSQFLDTDSVNKEMFPIMYESDPEAAEERAFIETELYAYIGSFTAESIAKGIDDAEWNQHLADLESYRYYEWLGMYQDMIDEAAARVG